MKHRFFYQPSPIFSTIDWCWTFIILLTGIIFWLEVTHFQWITMCFFIAFFVVAGAELLNRQLVFNGSVMIVKDVFGRQWHRFNLKSIQSGVSFTSHTVKIVKHGHTYQFSLSKPAVRKCQRLVRAVIR